MAPEFQSKYRDRRFLFEPDDVRNTINMTQIVDPDSAISERGEHGAARQISRTKAVNWLWHPWYAKLWWTGVVVYWSVKTASFAIPTLDDFYTSALAGFLNIFFFPPLALMVLGLGFAREWFEWSDWEFVEPTHEQMFLKRSVGGMRDPCADPLDPRSGALHWRRVDGGH